MDSVNAQAEAGKHLLNFLGKGGKALNSSLGKRFAGMLACPLKRKNLEDISAYKDISEDKEALENRSGFEKIRDAIVERFAFGDLMSVAGLALYGLQTQIGPKKPGLIGGLFRNAALAMTFFGSTTAAFGRTFDYDKVYAYGDKYGLHMIKEAEARGKKIFTVYDELKMKELESDLPKLRKHLVYKPGLEETIKFRHEQSSIGGMFDGPHGTGKTEGVRLAMAEKAEQIKAKGDKPVIVELNLAHFTDYIDQRMSEQREWVELAEKLQGKGESGSLIHNQGIMILEGLISRVRDLRKQVDEYNKNHQGAPQKKLIIFIDEFDKALQTRTLKGCDKTRLRNLLIQFNEIFVNEDILLTSNTKLEKMRKSLAEHVKIDDDDTGETEVIGPMFDRLTAKNRALVEFPGSAEQAKIVAGRVLTEHKQNIDWQDFGVQELNSGSYEFDRDQFAAIVEKEITGKLQTKINGRQLASATDQLISMLVGKASKINSERRAIKDDAWQKMTAQEKINRTGAKIDKAMLRTVIESKLENMNLNHSQKDFDLSFKLINNYLQSSPISKLLKGKEARLKADFSLDAVLSSLYEVRTNDANTVYVAKDPIEFNGKKYQHVITKYSGKDPSLNVSFAELGSKALEDLTMYDFVGTKRISSSLFTQEFKPLVIKAAENPLQKAVDSLINAFAGAGLKGEVKLKDEDVKTVAREAVKNILGTAA